MFRTTKKKKKVASSRSIRRVDDSNDEETGPITIQPIIKEKDNDSGDGSDEGGANLALLRAKQRQKKSKKQQIRSNASSNSRTTVKAGGSSKSRKRQRIGFGGSAISNENTMGQEDDEADTNLSSLYDTDALAQLKAEQAQWKSPDEKALEVAKQERVPGTQATENEIENHDSTKMRLDDEEGFIPFNQSNEQNETVLAGDEAFEIAGTPHSGTKPDPTKSFQNESNNEGETYSDNEESDELWQRRISQRAGVQMAKSERKTSSTKPLSSSQRPYLAFEELRQQFSGAQEVLENQINDVNNALKRRQVDIDHTSETEIQQHLDAVQKHGQAIEFYQGWRAMAVPHVAALRDLGDKLDKIHALVVEMLVKVSDYCRNRALNEADDLFASLKECNALDRVVGRQPDPSIFLSQDAMGQVDEFGRSVKSQQTLLREKRTQERELIDQKKKIIGEKQKAEGLDQDDWMTPQEVDDLQEQKSSLYEALQFALSQIKPDFADISVLAALFSDWMQHDIHEYKECYAGLSLADLASVLLRRDMYSAVLTGDKVMLETLGYGGDESLMKLLDRDAATRLDEKSVTPMILDLISKRAYGFASRSRSILLTSIVKNAFCGTSQGTNFKTMIKGPLIVDVKRSLGEIGLPVLSTESGVLNGNTSLTSVQLEALERLFQYTLAAVETIILWDRAIGLEGLGGNVLDFLLSTFLTSISSVHSLGEMHKNEKLRLLARNSFSKVWADIQSTPWMQNTDWLVQLTTLQAAASVYVDQ